MELPPRARRIRWLYPDYTRGSGTTSACAENTFRDLGKCCLRRNYLRVRGEYNDIWERWEDKAELPPRARRILYSTHGRMQMTGTTSACAENTEREKIAYKVDGNYLRVRGEYPWPRALPPPYRELPPRARRILIGGFQPFHGGGTTSACAENTPTSTQKPGKTRNYLRVRGEYWRVGFPWRCHGELPPRARRIRGAGE